MVNAGYYFTVGFILFLYLFGMILLIIKIRKNKKLKLRIEKLEETVVTLYQELKQNE